VQSGRLLIYFCSSSNIKCQVTMHICHISCDMLYIKKKCQGNPSVYVCGYFLVFAFLTLFLLHRIHFPKCYVYKNFFLRLFNFKVLVFIQICSYAMRYRDFLPIFLSIYCHTLFVGPHHEGQFRIYCIYMNACSVGADH